MTSAAGTLAVLGAGWAWLAGDGKLSTLIGYGAAAALAGAVLVLTVALAVTLVRWAVATVAWCVKASVVVGILYFGATYLLSVDGFALAGRVIASIASR